MRVDRIFEGSTLLAMDPSRPRATALAVLGGRIVAVGDGTSCAAIEVLATLVGGTIADDDMGLELSARPLS